MQAECTSRQLEFERIGGREVVDCFDGRRMTSDGGALLLRAADRLFEVKKMAAAVPRVNAPKTPQKSLAESLSGNPDVSGPLSFVLRIQV